MSKNWTDPLPDPETQQSASSVKGAGLMQTDIPEWKKQAFGGKKVIFICFQWSKYNDDWNIWMYFFRHSNSECNLDFIEFRIS